jgi:hypothetical protein
VNFGRSPLAGSSWRRLLPNNYYTSHRVNNKLRSSATDRVSASLKLDNEVLQVRALRITNGQPELGKYWGEEELARLGCSLTGTR